MSDRRPGAFPLVIATALSLSLSAHAVGQSSSDSLDAHAYAGQLRELAEQLRTADAAALPDIERQLPTHWRVQIAGRPVDLSSTWIQRQLQQGARVPGQWPANRGRLLEQLAVAQREALDLEADPADVSSARSVLDGVLSRPEFARIAKEDAWTRVQERIFEWLKRLWTGMGGDRLAVRSTAEAFAWIASLLALALLAGWLIHTLRRSARLGGPPPEAEESRRTTASVWAQRAAAASDPREMVRCAYRAVVSRFHEDGTWRADDSRTPREYMRLLPRDHARRRPVEDIVRRFEDVWFAGRVPTADDRGALIRQLRELGCLPAE